MAVETQTRQAKKNLVDAMRADLEDDALKALTTALEIFRALAADAKGVDQGVAEACKHWDRHLDKMLQDVKTEVAALSKRMGATQPHKITEVVDLPHAKAVAAAREA